MTRDPSAHRYSRLSARALPWAAIQGAAERLTKVKLLGMGPWVYVLLSVTPLLGWETKRKAKIFGGLPILPDSHLCRLRWKLGGEVGSFSSTPVPKWLSLARGAGGNS